MIIDQCISLNRYSALASVCLTFSHPLAFSLSFFSSFVCASWLVSNICLNKQPSQKHLHLHLHVPLWLSSHPSFPPSSCSSQCCTAVCCPSCATFIRSYSHSFTSASIQPLFDYFSRYLRPCCVLFFFLLLLCPCMAFTSAYLPLCFFLHLLCPLARCHSLCAALSCMAD